MVLQVHRLAYERGDRQLFSDIHFELKAGEALWLAGSNGSGKTSLLRLLCGLAIPTLGEIHWHGRNIQHVREDFHRDLIYCAHASGMKDDLRAWENLAIGARISGFFCSKEDAYQALDEMGLASVAHLQARSLSQGQRKRVALARLCLKQQPSLLILDEPFTALDQHAVSHLCATLNRHLASGSVVIYTTHQELALETSRLHLLDLDRAGAC